MPSYCPTFPALPPNPHTHAHTHSYEAEAERVGAANETRGETYKMRKKVLDLLPNADENIKKLQEVVDNSAKRLMVLAEKWEGVRTALVGEYRQLRIAAQDKQNDSRKQLDKIKALREDMKGIATGAKDKERLCVPRE